MELDGFAIAFRGLLYVLGTIAVFLVLCLFGGGDPSWDDGLSYLAIAVVVAFPLLFVLEIADLIGIMRLQKEQPEPTFLLGNEALSLQDAHALVGKEGVVRTVLRPQGTILVDSRSYVVKSDGPFVDAGTPVRVDRIEGPNIIVIPIRECG